MAIRTINQPLNDESIMPFGKYGHGGKEGPCRLKNIPASYFHYIYHNYNNLPQNLVDYIKRCIPAFKKENPDLIWS